MSSHNKRAPQEAITAPTTIHDENRSHRASDASQISRDSFYRLSMPSVHSLASLPNTPQDTDPYARSRPRAGSVISFNSSLLPRTPMSRTGSSYAQTGAEDYFSAGQTSREARQAQPNGLQWHRSPQESFHSGHERSEAPAAASTADSASKASQLSFEDIEDDSLGDMFKDDGETDDPRNVHGGAPAGADNAFRPTIRSATGMSLIPPISAFSAVSKHWWRQLGTGIGIQNGHAMRRSQSAGYETPPDESTDARLRWLGGLAKRRGNVHKHDRPAARRDDGCTSEDEEDPGQELMSPHLDRTGLA